MAADDVTDVVLSAGAFFKIFGTKDTDSDVDAKELCTVNRRRCQQPRHYWVHHVIIVDVKYEQCVHNAFIKYAYTALFFNCIKCF